MTVDRTFPAPVAQQLETLAQRGVFDTATNVLAAIAAAEDELARCQRRTGRLRPKRAARPVEQPPAVQSLWGNQGQ